jgi:hypothetical protein
MISGITLIASKNRFQLYLHWPLNFALQLHLVRRYLLHKPNDFRQVVLTIQSLLQNEEQLDASNRNPFPIPFAMQMISGLYYEIDVQKLSASSKTRLYFIQNKNFMGFLHIFSDHLE